jgi:hypothetical protein
MQALEPEVPEREAEMAGVSEASGSFLEKRTKKLS